MVCRKSLAFAACLALLASAASALSQDNAPAQDSGPLDDFSDLAPDQSEETAPQAPADIEPARRAALDRIAEVIEALDPDAQRQANNWQFAIDEVQILVVTDPVNDRMRILTPVSLAEALPEEALLRLLQANFDTALDARYAVAQELVWGTFIHPLESLTTREFASGVLQTKSLADTFGTTFSSGLLSYGGGDSSAIIEQQVEELLDQLEQSNKI